MEPGSPPNPNADPAFQETLSYDHDLEAIREAPASASVPSSLARGTSVDRYVILDRVGEGGMGVVYAAYDRSLDRRVALKFLIPGEVDHDAVREARLLREAQAMARLSHPNVAVVYEVGTFQRHVFLAMEYVDGVDLQVWRAEKLRTFSQILDVFHAAGRGLAAAHAAGIIHRDFKPENVLLDKHDRPRVTDFGLSRASRDPSATDSEGAAQGCPSELSTPSHLSTPLTRTGGVLGTPSYMPPEQHLGGMVDARSDQFSFCVALYETLHGEHPFGGTPAERMDNSVNGRVAEAPVQSSVPKWCRQALLRGLAAAPANRFPSMEALLAALSPRPMKRRRLVAMAASLAVILGGAGGYALFLARAHAPASPRCDLGAQHLAGVWNPARKLQLREAFQRSGAPGADVTWKGFAAIVDERAGAWAAMHNESCAATHECGLQSPAVLDLRMECLERKRLEMKALVDVYAEKLDVSSLDRAVAAADKLSSVSACADVANLRAVVPLPEDPQSRAKVESLRQRFSQSRALFATGRYELGREYMESLKREADAVGYAPLAAEAASALALHLSFAGKVEEAQKLLFEASEQAVKGRDWNQEAEILVTLIANYGRAGRAPESLLTARLAALAVDRANGDDALRARLAANTGGAEQTAGHPDEALRHFQRAEDLWKKALGARSPRYASALNNVGGALVDLGRMREGLDYLERALAIERATLRPDHPDTVYSMHNIAVGRLELGMFQKGREMASSASAIRTKELGPENALTISSRVLIADADAELGNLDRALDLYASLVAIEKRVLDPHDVFFSSTYVRMGNAQIRAGLEQEGERTLEQVMEHNANAGTPEHTTTGYALTYLGLLHNGHGLYGKALRECSRGLAILSRELGEASSRLMETRECIGEALTSSGDFDAARRELEPAITSASDRDLAPRRIAGPRFQLARALWSAPGERPRARELARAALNALATAEGDNHQLVARIQRWLQTHGDSSIRKN